MRGFRRSRPSPLPSISYRGFAVAPITLRAPSRSLLYNPGCRVETLLVSKGVMGFLGERVHSFHRLRTVPLPRRGRSWGCAGQGLRPCRRINLRAFRSPLGILRARLSKKPFIQPRVQGLNPARFNGGYGVPRGFKGEKSKSPPNPLGLAERVLRPQAVEGVLRRWKA